MARVQDAARYGVQVPVGVLIVWQFHLWQKRWEDFNPEDSATLELVYQDSSAPKVFNITVANGVTYRIDLQEKYQAFGCYTRSPTPHPLSLTPFPIGGEGRRFGGVGVGFLHPAIRH